MLLLLQGSPVTLLRVVQGEFLLKCLKAKAFKAIQWKLGKQAVRSVTGPKATTPETIVGGQLSKSQTHRATVLTVKEKSFYNIF